MDPWFRLIATLILIRVALKCDERTEWNNRLILIHPIKSTVSSIVRDREEHLICLISDAPLSLTDNYSIYSYYKPTNYLFFVVATNSPFVGHIAHALNLSICTCATTRTKFRASAAASYRSTLHLADLALSFPAGTREPGHMWHLSHLSLFPDEAYHLSPHSRFLLLVII